MKKPLTLILLLYLLLALAYGLATPPLEASDEYKHYPFVQYVQEQGKLPVLHPDDPGRWLQEAAQPPLYYLMMAALTAPIDPGDLAQVHQVNKHAFIGNPNQVGNKNLIIHDPKRESFPWQGTILAIYLIRLASVGLGVGTLLLIYRLGLRLGDEQAALWATAVTAFNPMFLFVSAAVNNDSLAILCGHAGLYLLVKLWQEPPAANAWPRFTRLGMVLGLGILTKLSLGGLLLLAGIALAILAWRRRSWALFFVGGPQIVLTALLVSGWWFWRNWQIYGDLTGLNAFIAVQGTRADPITWAGWIDEFGTFYRTFWGLFGGVNVAAPWLFYVMMNVLAVLGLIGLARRLGQRPWRHHFAQSGAWLPAAWTGILLLLLLRWNLISPAFQGRLIFPALGGIHLLLVAGWQAWVPPEWQPRLAAGPVGLLLIWAGLLPWITIRPAYAWPEPLTAVPAAARLPEPITFRAPDGAFRLVGVTMPPGQSVTPGEDFVAVTLYWQLDEAVQADYLSSIHLLGRENVSVGAVNRYPARGMIPTSRWQPGEIYADAYRLPVAETAVAPARLRVAVSLYDPENGSALPATSPGGVPLDPVLVGEPVRLAAHGDVPAPDALLDVPFGDGITLLGYTPAAETAVAGTSVPITLTWQAAANPARDYTVFVHLLDADRQWAAGADAPPVAGFYPTSMWQPGDRVDDVHLLTIPKALPPGTYPVLVGLYDPAGGSRLPRLDSPADFAEFSLIIER